MITQELLDYINAELGKGENRQDISAELLNAGWADADITEAFAMFDNTHSSVGQMTPQYIATTRSFISISELFSQTWSVFKKRVWVLVGIYLLAILPNMILQFAYGFLTESLLAKLSLTSIVLGVLVYGIYIITIAWSMGATIFAIKDSGENIGVIESYRRAKSKILATLWVFILFMFMIMGGMYLFIVPGMMFAIFFGFATFVLIGENIGGMNALLKSREYVRGYAWAVFGRMLLLFIIPVAIMIPVIISFAVSGAAAGAGLAGLSIVGIVLLILIYIFFTLFFPPFFQTYTYKMYESLKMLKGEMNFVPKTNKKVLYIVIASLGIIILVGAQVLLVALSTAREKAKQAENSSKSELNSEQNTSVSSNVAPSTNPLLESIPFSDSASRLSINAPKGWTVEKNDKLDEELRAVFSKKDPSGEVAIEVRAIENTDVDDVELYAKSISQVFQSALPQYKLISINKALVNGVDARRVEATFIDSGVSVKLLILVEVKDGGVYLVTAFIKPDSALPQYENVINASLYSLILK